MGVARTGIARRREGLASHGSTNFMQSCETPLYPLLYLS